MAPNRRSYAQATVIVLAAFVLLAVGFSMTLQWALLPHRWCLANNPNYIVPFVAFNLIIAGVYFAIPAVLYTWARGLPEIFVSTRLAYLFAIFITTCGLTHIMLIATVWVPAYTWQLVIDGACALASGGTLLELRRAGPDVTEMLTKIQVAKRLREQDPSLYERLAS